MGGLARNGPIRLNRATTRAVTRPVQNRRIGPLPREEFVEALCDIMDMIRTAVAVDREEGWLLARKVVVRLPGLDDRQEQLNLIDDIMADLRQLRERVENDSGS